MGQKICFFSIYKLCWTSLNKMTEQKYSIHMKKTEQAGENQGILQSPRFLSGLKLDKKKVMKVNKILDVIRHLNRRLYTIPQHH